jgi:hypothetical protein
MINATAIATEVARVSVRRIVVLRACAVAREKRA